MPSWLRRATLRWRRAAACPDERFACPPPAEPCSAWHGEECRRRAGPAQFRAPGPVRVRPAQSGDRLQCHRLAAGPSLLLLITRHMHNSTLSPSSPYDYQGLRTILQTGFKAGGSDQGSPHGLRRPPGTRPPRGDWRVSAEGDAPGRSFPGHSFRIVSSLSLSAGRRGPFICPIRFAVQSSHAAVVRAGTAAARGGLDLARVLL